MRVLFIVNEVSFFFSHRLVIAEMLLSMQAEVYVLAGSEENNEKYLHAIDELKKRGVRVVIAPYESTGKNLITEMYGLFYVIKKVIQFQPDVIHCASMKGNLYGSISSFFSRSAYLITTIAGKGYFYTEKYHERKLIKWIFRKAYEYVYQIAISRKKHLIIAQNMTDYLELRKNSGLSQSCIRLIRGSGVNVSQFDECDISKKEKIILCPARVLYTKGIEEFVEASHIASKELKDWKFLVAGGISRNNPAAVQEDKIIEWKSKNIVNFCGHVKDISKLFCSASIVCLPSYREGLPKVLLEASAARCAIITSDAIGCRDVVEDGSDGLIVKVGAVDELAQAMIKLAKDLNLTKKFIEASYLKTTENFSEEIVVAAFRDIYEGISKKVIG